MDQRPILPGQFPVLKEYIWRVPLVPIALALTLGVLLDRHFAIPLYFSFVVCVASAFAWWANTRGGKPTLALVYLWIGCAALAAAHHHSARDVVARNDIRYQAAAEAKPVRLRGVVASEPIYVRGSTENTLRSFPSTAATRFALQVDQLKTAVAWLDVTGQAQVTLQARVDPVHVGDRVEIVGRMVLPAPPANPGEFDYRDFLRDQGIGVLVSVPASTEGIKLLAQGWPHSLTGLLAVTRAWGQGVIARYLPPRYAAVGGALLLGEGSGMTGDDWDKYARTGVIHVLAISGQHLVVLGCFLWFLTRVCGISRRRGALFIALFLFLYALTTGGRPPVMRSAWAMAACCGGIWLRRLTLPAGTFALGWIAVLATNPTDIFNIGCQLSFLAVAVLFWGTGPKALSSVFLGWVPFVAKEPMDADLQRLIDESRPLTVMYLIRLKRRLVDVYRVNATVWLAVTPLVAGTLHLVSPVALLIGPPLVLLTSVALLSGFLLLLAAPVGLGSLFAWPAAWSLGGCELLVDWGLALPGGYFFVPDIPAWWTWCFYILLLSFLTVPSCRRRPLAFGAAASAWLIVGGAILWGLFKTSEFRCTFLAVGHGGCTVLETDDGRVLVYDAGSIGGPDLTRRHIAPFLWHRGIWRVDDLIVSHADLDHFNGVVALVDRFSVGRVTLTPSFAERLTPAVQLTLHELHKRGIAVRVVKAGDDLGESALPASALHPPAVGPDGNENARSLVLLLRPENLAILLTGDLEGPGLERVLALPKPKIDVLMAPHHGSKTSNKAELANWAKAKLAISSQGPPRGNPKAANPYAPLGTTYLTTWKHGAVTIHKEQGKWIAETYVTKKRIDLN